MGRCVWNLGDGGITADFLHAQDIDTVGFLAENESQNLVRSLCRSDYLRIGRQRCISLLVNNTQAAERIEVARIRPGMSRIRATEPSPRMVAPETPST